MNLKSVSAHSINVPFAYPGLFWTAVFVNIHKTLTCWQSLPSLKRWNLMGRAYSPPCVGSPTSAQSRLYRQLQQLGYDCDTKTEKQKPLSVRIHFCKRNSLLSKITPSRLGGH